ncbi:MAG: hypothetical protein J7K51_05220, partial [Thermotogae bacterium]|nr:hypothetical protein [Thermotogota bacterium]
FKNLSLRFFETIVSQHSIFKYPFMFISFVLIQVKRTREKAKTPMGYIAFCGSIVNSLVRINFILHCTYP